MVRGFLLNNELTDFSALPEGDGKPVANRVEPGKRPRSSMSPTFVLDRDRKLFAGAGLGRRAAHHRRHAADLIGMLDWNLSTAGRHRPAARRQHERPDRARGRHAAGRPRRTPCARWAIKYKSAGMTAA